MKSNWINLQLTMLRIKVLFRENWRRIKEKCENELKCSYRTFWFLICNRNLQAFFHVKQLNNGEGFLVDIHVCIQHRENSVILALQSQFLFHNSLIRGIQYRFCHLCKFIYEWVWEQSPVPKNSSAPRPPSWFWNSWVHHCVWLKSYRFWSHQF